jgi:membrane-associated HD superfamily phosphohydrolase
MLTIEEQKFLSYWTVKRNENKLNPFFFAKGFALGLLIGILVLICLFIGWYKRANMDAATKLNPYIMLIAIISIAIFLAIFYNSFKFEQNEQLYKELKRKEGNSTT